MTDLITYYPMLALAFCLVFALCVGSFLNVVIHRLPLMMERQWQAECDDYLAQQTDSCEPASPNASEQSAPFNLMVPRSRCPECNSLIRAWQNIPVISWLLLGGKCANCKTKISIRYPLVEVASALLCLACWSVFGFTTSFVFACLFSWLMLTLALIDFDTMLLPDQLTLPGMWLGLLLATQSLFASPIDAIIGAAAGYLFLWSIFWAFKLLTGKEGMGYGDFKLLALIGAWFGWQALPLVVLLSSLSGAVLGIILLVTRRQQQGQPMPFGPYLAMGGLCYLYIGPELYQWYLGALL
ncbi:prepilin peptidase [Aliagarivorans taiwanensis]|uniref:prepilin peptidase n=1 Tax=Aliagarivorans taiwanensis TaxID=561966 RepID=UPI00041B3766|nr:A24 family peptidase [Aliagarivorans taiwanensis]